MGKKRANIFVTLIFALLFFSTSTYAKEKQEYQMYQDAIAATVASGKWTENLSMTANMRISDEGTKVKTKFMVTSTMNIWDYDENNLSDIKMKGSASMNVMNQMYAWNVLYENGIAHYEYEKPEQSSVDIEIEPDYFDFNTFTQDMMQNVRVCGNKIMFMIPGDEIEETGIAAVNLISGIENLNYNDVEVEAVIDKENGTIDTVMMLFSASLTYQGYEAEVDYHINYDFSNNNGADIEEREDVEDDISEMEMKDGIVIYSDYKNLSIRKDSAITLGAGIIINGEQAEDISGITFSVEDTSILSVGDTNIENNRVYVKFNGKNAGTTQVIFNDSNTGYMTKVPVSVYEDNYLSYTLNSVPLQYIEKYPTNFYNFNGLYIDSYSYTVNDNKTATVSFDVYNTNYTYGIIEIYNAKGELKDVVIIGKMSSNNTSIKKALWDNSGCLIRDMIDGDLLSYRQESGFSKRTPVTVEIPKDGYIKICNDPQNSVIVNIINSVDVLMSLDKLANKVKNYDVNAEIFMKELTVKLINEKFFATLVKDGSNFSDDLWKGVATKAAFSSESLGDFSNTIAKNLGELDFGEVIAETAADFGLSIGEEVFTYFMGPIKMVFDGLFAFGKLESIIIQHVDLMNSANVGSIYIQNQGGGIRSSQQITVESDSEFSEDTSLNVFRVELNSVILEKMKKSNPEVYDKIKERTSYTYNISLLKKGMETQPNGEVTVYIPIPDDMKLLAYVGKPQIYRFENDGTLTEMNVKIEDGCLAFKTSHFSLYTLVGGSEWKAFAIGVAGVVFAGIVLIVFIGKMKQKRKQDGKIEMKNYCGKCGSRINQETGLCPNCDKELEMKIHRKKRKKKIFKGIILFIVILLIGIGMLSYFEKINIPVVSDWINENIVWEEFSEVKNSLVGEEKKDSDIFVPTVEELVNNEEESSGEMNRGMSTVENKQDGNENNIQEFENDERKNTTVNIQQTSQQDSSSDQLARKNYYNKDGELIYYETYVYYDNGRLCSTTMHSVKYLYEGDSYAVNNYTLLYLYDEDGNLRDTVLGALTISEWYNESTEEIILDMLYDSAGNSTAVCIYPLKESIEQAGVGVDASRTEEIYEKTLVIPTGTNNSWAKVYFDNILVTEEFADIAECRLIYVDNNVVPELWINDGEHGEIYTQNENGIDEIWFNSGAPFWKEKENFLWVTGGHMGNYYEQIYEIQDGEFIMLEEGSSFESMADNAADGTYYWNNVEVTEDVYYQHYQSLHEADYIDRNQNIYTYKQCKLLLKSIMN